MLKKPSLSVSTIILTALVAACQAGGGGGSSSSRSSNWAEDACKTFPRDAAAKVTGVAVANADSSGQTGNEQTLVSNCTYSTADGKTNFAVLLRQAKSDAETIDQQIAGMKSQPEVTGPSEDVAMPKGKAVWAIRMHTLSYVPANGRVIVVTPPGAITFGTGGPPPGDLKAKAIAIATAIEG